MNIGEKIKLYRVRQRMSQKDLALFLGVSRQTVLKWEGGSYCPDLYKISIILNTLNVSAHDLLINPEYNESSSFENDIPYVLDSNTIASNISELRQKFGVSRAKLSEISGVTRQTAARWERASSIPELYSVIAMAEYFSVGICEILK